MADGPQRVSCQSHILQRFHHHPVNACGHEGCSHLSPFLALWFFIAVQVVQHSYSSTTRQPIKMVEFYSLTLSSFPFRYGSQNTNIGFHKTRTISLLDFRTIISRCAWLPIRPIGRRGLNYSIKRVRPVCNDFQGDEKPCSIGGEHRSPPACTNESKSLRDLARVCYDISVNYCKSIIHSRHKYIFLSTQNHSRPLLSTPFGSLACVKRSDGNIGKKWNESARCNSAEIRCSI